MCVQVDFGLLKHRSGSKKQNSRGFGHYSFVGSLVLGDNVWAAPQTTVMNEPNLVYICVIAFIAVMLLLSFEALVISLISRLFPARKSDRELVAEVIEQAISKQFPGAKVVAVEEVDPKKN